MLHCFEDNHIDVGDIPVTDGIGALARADAASRLVNRGGPAELLLLQDRPWLFGRSGPNRRF